MLTELEEKLVNLAQQQEALKDQLKQNHEEMEKVLASLGVGHVFQGLDGVVYQVHVPKGAFTYFHHIDYKRTRREGEKGGDFLAKTEAKNLGFDVD